MEDLEMFIQEFNEVIEAIVSVVTQEELKILEISRGETVKITFKEQLIAYYKGRGPVYNPSSTKVRAATIMEGQRLNIEKLKIQNFIIQELIKPEAYYKGSEQSTEGEKSTGIISKAHSGTASDTFAQNKGRSGTAHHYEEYDKIGDGDEADQATLKALNAQPYKDKGAQEPSFENIAGSTKKNLIFSDIEKPKEEKPEVTLKEVEGEEVPLDTIDLSVNRGYTHAKVTASSTSGKQVNSDKKTIQKTKTYITADVLDRIQQFQYIDIREKILQSFSCLFFYRRSSGACQ